MEFDMIDFIHIIKTEYKYTSILALRRKLPEYIIRFILSFLSREPNWNEIKLYLEPRIDRIKGNKKSFSDFVRKTFSNHGVVPRDIGLAYLCRLKATLPSHSTGTPARPIQEIITMILENEEHKEILYPILLELIVKLGFKK